MIAARGTPRVFPGYIFRVLPMFADICRVARQGLMQKMAVLLGFYGGRDRD